MEFFHNRNSWKNRYPYTKSYRAAEAVFIQKKKLQICLLRTAVLKS